MIRQRVAALVAAIALAGCVADDPAGSRTDAAEPLGSESTLYVQTSRSALLLPSGEGHDLVLMDPDPRITFFAERPARDAGTMSAADMVAILFDPASPPPNAALVGTPVGEAAPITLAVELSAPRLDAGRVTYQVRMLPGLDDAWAFVGSTTSVAPPALQDVELFIDSAQFHRCHAKLRNHTDVTFYLDVGSMDPPSGSNHWTNVDQTIPPQSEVTWELRFKMDGYGHTRHQNGVLVYFDSPDGQGYSLSTHLVCQTAASNDGVALSSTTCTSDLYASPFLCSTQLTDKSRTAVFTVTNR